jgi:hypothetical protein
MASMAEELSSQAEQLAQTMSFFKIQASAAGSAVKATVRPAAAVPAAAHRVSVAHAKRGAEKSAEGMVSAERSAVKTSSATGITIKKASVDELKDEDFEEF